MKKRNFFSLIFVLVMVMSMCACKKEPKIVVCGPTTYTFYADNAEAAVDRLFYHADQAEAFQDSEEVRRMMKSLEDIPTPKEGAFRLGVRDYGAGDGPFSVIMDLRLQYQQHFLVEYAYPLATFSYTSTETGEEVSRILSIRYCFYRVYIYKNQILQSVGEYYESYFSKNDRYNEGEMIDGKLYVRKGDSVKVFFDLNPGIGVVELNDSTDSLNDIPFEALLPLCQWKLVRIAPSERESVTDHVGWW